jgi:hypothetical protein
MCISAAIIGGSAITAGIGAAASKKAGDATSKAARQATDAQLQMFETQREDFAPWREAGTNALQALQFELGLGQRPVFGAASLPEIQTVNNPGAFGWIPDPRDLDPFNTEYTSRPPVYGPTGPATPNTYRIGDQSFNSLAEAEAFAKAQAAKQPGMAYRGFQATPGYAFRVGEGTKAIERSAAARGGLNSGATMKALAGFGQNIAAEEYGSYINRLGALAGTGQTATAQTSALGVNAANNIAQNQLAAGQARGSAYLGMNNAFQGGIQNAMALGARYGGWFE